MESLEGVEGDAEFFKGLYLVLISEDEPEETSQVHDFRWVVEEEFLVPVGMTSVLN